MSTRFFTRLNTMLVSHVKLSRKIRSKDDKVAYERLKSIPSSKTCAVKTARKSFFRRVKSIRTRVARQHVSNKMRLQNDFNAFAILSLFGLFDLHLIRAAFAWFLRAGKPRLILSLRFYRGERSFYPSKSREARRNQ